MSDSPSIIWPRSLFLVRHGESAGNVARDAAVAARQPMIDITVRGTEIANCSVTRYDLDETRGKHRMLELETFNFTALVAEEGTPVTAAPDVKDAR